MTSKGLLQCHKHRQSLFAQSREIAAQATKARDPFWRAEAARDLLLHFDHAQIALGLVVVKRHGEVEQEAEHLPLAQREAIQQIARRALPGPPYFEAEIILLCVRWYLRYALSYRDLEEMMYAMAAEIRHTLTSFRQKSFIRHREHLC